MPSQAHSACQAGNSVQAPGHQEGLLIGHAASPMLCLHPGQPAASNRWRYTEPIRRLRRVPVVVGGPVQRSVDTGRTAAGSAPRIQSAAPAPAPGRDRPLAMLTGRGCRRTSQTHPRSSLWDSVAPTLRKARRPAYLPPQPRSRQLTQLGCVTAQPLSGLLRECHEAISGPYAATTSMRVTLARISSSSFSIICTSSVLRSPAIGASTPTSASAISRP